VICSQRYIGGPCAHFNAVEASGVGPVDNCKQIVVVLLEDVYIRKYREQVGERVVALSKQPTGKLVTAVIRVCSNLQFPAIGAHTVKYGEFHVIGIGSVDWVSAKVDFIRQEHIDRVVPVVQIFRFCAYTEAQHFELHPQS